MLIVDLDGNYGRITAKQPDHQGNTMFKAEWLEGGYDWLYSFEFEEVVAQ